MTETYQGPSSPVNGDRPKENTPDVYHSYPVSKLPGVLNEPLSGAYKARVTVSVPVPEVPRE